MRPWYYISRDGFCCILGEKYPPGSYTHNLISEDITRQEEQLARFKEEVGSIATETAVSAYQQRIMDFLEFLNVMHGRYEHATFQEKRNAKEEPYLLVHHDEVAKLQQRGFLQRNTQEVVRARVDISYSPRFAIRGVGGNNLTRVPVSLHTLRYIYVSACCTPCTL